MTLISGGRTNYVLEKGKQQGWGKKKYGKLKRKRKTELDILYLIHAFLLFRKLGGNRNVGAASMCFIRG
jgi:hypothetical protein